MLDIVKVSNVHLSYKFRQSQNLKSLFIGKRRKASQYFEALKGVTFEVQRGVNLGIIGSNGSGKSTLLRLLASTLTPDSGKIENNANSVSLLSLGIGFRAELTGRNNIYLNGLLLGIDKKSLDSLIDDIIGFAEIDDFIDRPVSSYSSGMKSRLSFSIAINIDPELLLIDELFSVGDERFRKKSHSKIVSMINDNRTVVMVSHNLSLIRKYCSRVLWLEEGEVAMIGKPEEVIQAYIATTGN